MISQGMETGLGADGDADVGMQFLLENQEQNIPRALLFLKQLLLNQSITGIDVPWICECRAVCDGQGVADEGRGRGSLTLPLVGRVAGRREGS
ncbi:hypothetical protein ABCW43_05125 [Neorhizobium sp. IRAMC:178]|uniref:hypothetical protein n=1 Tax=Neorhizobium tunisiense TaxID=3144793 RepID=UPI0031F702C2